MIIVVTSVVSSLPLFILMVQHVRQKTISVSQTSQGALYDAVEESIKHIQAESYFYQPVRRQKIQERQNAVVKVQRKIIWNSTLTGIFTSKKFYILLMGLLLNLCKQQLLINLVRLFQILGEKEEIANGERRILNGENSFLV